MYFVYGQISFQYCCYMYGCIIMSGILQYCCYMYGCIIVSGILQYCCSPLPVDIVTLFAVSCSLFL